MANQNLSTTVIARFFERLYRPIVAAMLFAYCLIASHQTHAATQVLNDVNIANEKYKNVLIVLTNSEVESFPYDQAYGVTNYWTKWDVLLNDDNTYSFRLNGKYISADSDDTVDLVTSLSDHEKFYLEAGNGSYYFKTWRGSYISAVGSGWKDLTQTWEKTSAEEWLFYDLQTPGSENLSNITIANLVYKNILIVLTGNEINSFPYDQAYGANNYWTRWSIIDNGDNTVSLKLNNKYAKASLTGGVTFTSGFEDSAKFTLESANQGTYYLISQDGGYVYATGSGWNDLAVSASTSDEARWNFFSRQDVDLFTFEPPLTLQSGTVSNIDESVSTVNFSSQQTSAPLILANMQTFNGTDTADLRIKNIDTWGFDTFVQEEQSKDSEVDHNNETLGYLYFDAGVIFDVNGNAIGETGSMTFTQSNAGDWFTQSFVVGNYQDPVVIMVTNTVAGSHASHIRLKNITTTEFKYQLEEWDYLDGTHAEESATYLVVESGYHELANNQWLQAKTQKIDHDFKTVTFDLGFSSAPVVLSQTQTVNGSSSVNTRQKSVTSSSVQIRLQEQESDNGTHDDEWVGVISFGS